MPGVRLGLMSLPLEISPEQASQVKDQIRLLDVREPEEHAICRIEGAELIPMGTVPAHLQDLDGEERLLVVFCHHGVRSLSVVDWLRRQGVENCQSMAGGIDLWSRLVDPSVPRY
jgi:rhodanese-related sulfurtransferase